MTPICLAGVNFDNLMHELIPSGSSVAEGIIVFGSLFVLTLALFAWAAFFRGSRRRRRRRHSHESPADSAAGKSSHSRHGHHHPEEDLPRNPTLAEAGGLPPIREDQRPPRG